MLTTCPAQLSIELANLDSIMFNRHDKVHKRHTFVRIILFVEAKIIPDISENTWVRYRRCEKGICLAVTRL